MNHEYDVSWLTVGTLLYVTLNVQVVLLLKLPP
jgi:hypothetical protein